MWGFASPRMNRTLAMDSLVASLLPSIPVCQPGCSKKIDARSQDPPRGAIDPFKLVLPVGSFCRYRTSERERQ
jgi:hypothetical protein